MLANGTQVVAGVAEGQGGVWVAGVPVFDSAKEAMAATDANASVLCVPADQVCEGLLEEIDAGLELIVCLTSSVPVRDMVLVRSHIRDRPLHLIGPDSVGAFTPGQCLAGVISEQILTPGAIGVVSRSGSLTYEVTWQLTAAGLGQSTVVCIGSGLIVGISIVDVLAMFEDDPVTEQVVVVGEIGGQEEGMAANFVRDHMSKPVVAFVAGKTSPPGRRMGHAGAVVEGYAGSAQSKMEAFERAGAHVAHTIAQIPELLERSAL
jgi:succinyl-CoA synthetase alpha subunit